MAYMNGTRITFTDLVNAPVTIDPSLSETSENPVQNKAIVGALTALTEKMLEVEGKIPAPVTIDPSLSETSENPVQNKAVVGALTVLTEKVLEVEGEIPDPVTVDSELNGSSTNPIQNSAVAYAISNIQSRLTQGENAIEYLSDKTLPDVSANENGKILQVVGGAWATADAPEGGSVTVDSEFSDTSENPVQNKVITAAISEAGTVLGELQAGMEQGVQAIQYLSSKTLPEVTTDDNGKILQVENGAWVAVEVATWDGGGF